jgi:uncharacterized membrane protein
MKEAIMLFFEEAVGQELSVILCSMIPIIELRGAIPVGWFVFDMPWWQSYLFAVIGNIIPVPFILLFIRKVLDWMEHCRVGFFNKIAGWLRRKADKNVDKITKYGFWGVCFFIAIPLPVTGAWTGSLVAATIKMNFWKALLSALLGVLIAGVIVTLICLGINSGVTWLEWLI